MKKLLTLITTLLITSAAFAVDFTWAAYQATKNDYDARLAYLESLTGIAEGEVISGLTIEQFKIVNICHLKVGAVHAGKDATFIEQAAREGKELFYANVNKLTDMQVFKFADRIGDWQLAVSKFSVVNNMAPQDKIRYAVKYYKLGIISKDNAIAILIDASDDEIKDQWFPALAKAVDSIPVRDNNGKAFMTAEQKKEFYGNFKDLNKVTAASADFLGAVVTQYNLVK